MHAAQQGRKGKGEEGPLCLTKGQAAVPVGARAAGSGSAEPLSGRGCDWRQRLRARTSNQNRLFRFPPCTIEPSVQLSHAPTVRFLLLFASGLDCQHEARAASPWKSPSHARARALRRPTPALALLVGKSFSSRRTPR